MPIIPLLLVALGGFGGWLIGRNNPRHKFFAKEKDQFSKDYFVGLNYLLNEQPDEAVDVFIKMLDVDNNTVETHMALGSLFRKRGETNRAIRIHQNIIARPNLGKDLRLQALQELGRDYMVAGVYDRAERLFLESVETNGPHRVQSLHYLVDIYEREKDWYAALEMAQQLQRIAKLDAQPAIAQYYCEIIEDPRNQLTFNKVSEHLRDAYNADRHCLRAGLLKAKQESEGGDDSEAIHLYQKMLHQDPDFAPIILPLLEKAYVKQSNEKGFIDYLYKSLDKITRPAVMVKLAEKLETVNGPQAAIQFLQQQLHESPSLQAIESLITLQAELQTHDATQEQATMLKQYLHKVNAAKPKYLCDHCGYQGRKMHWLCPSCRRWGEVKPSVGD
jgi:lipopolysaccharide biosynthesis regulator YciM